MKLDWTQPEMISYAAVPLRGETWWERGRVRYGMLSYSLWTRHIYWDVRGKKPPKKNKAAQK